MQPYCGRYRVWCESYGKPNLADWKVRLKGCTEKPVKKGRPEDQTKKVYWKAIQKPTGKIDETGYKGGISTQNIIHQQEKEVQEAEVMGNINGFIGTYASEKSKGVYRFTFDTDSGTLGRPDLFYEARDAKWVSLFQSTMAVPVAKDERAGTCLLDISEGKAEVLGEVLEEKHTPCYILQDDTYVYTANYHEGLVMIYEKRPRERDGLLLVKKIAVGHLAGCHQIIFHGTLMLVPCLMLDRILCFDRTADFEKTGELIFPENSGPRHGVFNREHSKFWVVSERSNEVYCFSVKGESFHLMETLPILETLPLPDMLPVLEREACAAAAVRLSDDERFLYISLRGADQIAVLKVDGEHMELVERVSSQGEHPRDFILSKDGQFLLTVNRNCGGLVSMKRDLDSGKIVKITGRAEISQGVSVIPE